ncbi:hypothetical protein [Niabella soli]|uniref:Uncharacterized protein n=1 Tax=Niabella soli DSM 19437 TaxID=929713 RepID=W0F9H4_9BACT|nr:hypothetical protein [Niabella soli]AHF18041.1 hypothetical protein NIASO_19275 [Niabella soli DSM 19437]
MNKIKKYKQLFPSSRFTGKNAFSNGLKTKKPQQTMFTVVTIYKIMYCN